LTTLFSKIGNSQTLSQQVEQKIEEVIRKKKLLPGDKLPTEKELCEMFAVSRTALREALRMLSARGLITVRKGSGMYVSNFSSSHAIKPMSIYLELNFDKNYIPYVIKVRKMLEPEIARMAALNRSQQELELLQKNLKSFVNCTSDDVQKQGELDREFHLTIATASGNPIIPIIVEPIFKLMPKIRSIVYAQINQAKSSALNYHQLLFDKIREKDADGAYDVMTKHLEIAEKHSQVILDHLD